RPARAVGRDEMPVRPEYLRLRRFLEIRADLQGVPRGQRQAPADARIARRNLDHALEESADIERIAAEFARLETAIEAGLVERAMQFLGIETALLGLGRVFAHLGAQRLGARDH